MSMKIDFREVMDRMKSDINYIAKEAYEKGYNDGKKHSVGESVKKAEYQRGLEDAWEAARKIVLSPDEGGTSLPDLSAMFGKGSMQYVFRNYSAAQAIAKLRRKTVEEIKVRDEVMVYGNRGVVTYIYNDTYTVMMYDGSCGDWKRAELKKTGKQHDIDKILEEMRT